MLQKLVVAVALMMFVALRAFAAVPERWAADYIGGAPLVSDIYPPGSRLGIHLEFIESFQPTPNAVVDINSLRTAQFAIGGMPVFPPDWVFSSAGLMLQLDSDSKIASWRVQFEMAPDVGAPTQFQLAGTYYNGGPVPGFWEQIELGINGNYSILGRQDAVVGNWSLSPVPELSTGVQLLSGLGLSLLLASGRRGGFATLK